MMSAPTLPPARRHQKKPPRPSKLPGSKIRCDLGATNTDGISRDLTLCHPHLHAKKVNSHGPPRSSPCEPEASPSSDHHLAGAGRLTKLGRGAPGRTTDRRQT